MRNFFERQSDARRKTYFLVLYFVAAVLVVAATVSMALYLLFTYDEMLLETSIAPFNLNWRTWNYAAIAQIGAGVLFIIMTGAIYKYYRLARGGGALIAQEMGGQIVYPDTADLHERRLLNIVEEMAIASGVAVPTVFLLAGEKGINAFAAGFSQEDAVIGVTWGALHRLNREELQGVIGHEFSHILSGDMLINIRLLGLLHGILLIGLLGRSLLRSAGRSRGNSKGRGGGLLFGLTLFILGYIGFFIGKIIKSAISRQREYLADASAVQFTRNPAGLAGALKKIGGLGEGSKIRNPNAAEISHMYFSNSETKGLSGFLSTHPPLLERIQRLEPGFKGTFPENVQMVEIDNQEAMAYAAAFGNGPAPLAAGIPAIQERTAAAGSALVSGEELGAAINAESPVDVQMGRNIIDSIPNPLLRSARNGFGARAVLFGLLLDQNQEVRTRQLRILEEHTDAEVRMELRLILPAFSELRQELRLPLLDFAIPALKTLSPKQYDVFRANIKRLVECDGRTDLFEYCLMHVLFRHLEANFGKVRKQAVHIHSMAQAGDEISCVLTMLAQYGHTEESAARKAMMKAVRVFDEKHRKNFTFRPESCDLKTFHESLKKLAATSLPIRQKFVEAALECVAWDKRITVKEAELLRVIMEALDSPVPPWLKIAGSEAPNERPDRG